MKAAMVTDIGVVSIEELERPVPKDDEVVIKVAAAGVCGSDLHLFHGTHALRRHPAVLGHEVTGEIVETGAKVTRFKLGDRVTVEPQIICGKCEFCRANLIHLCTDKATPGTPKWLGTFVEYFNAPEQTLHRLDDTVSYDLGVIIEPLAVAVHALRRANTANRDAVVILGAGSIGLLSQVVAREMGFKTIITTDTVPFNREMSLRHGAALSLDPLREDVVAKVRELTGGRGADLAIVAAGVDTILDQASACVRKRGEIGLIAMMTKKIPFYSYGMVFNEQRMYGAMAYEARDFKEATDMVNGGLDLSPFITQRLPLERSREALEILSQKKENVIKVIVTM